MNEYSTGPGPLDGGRKKLNDKKSGFDYWQEGDKYEYKEYCFAFLTR